MLGSKFRKGYGLRQTHEVVWMIQQLKLCEYKNKDESGPNVEMKNNIPYLKKFDLNKFF